MRGGSLRILWIALGVLSAFCFFYLSLAEEQTIYTIHITSTSELEDAKKDTKHISSIIPLPVRLEIVGRNYIIRAGISKKPDVLAPYLETIKGRGYPQASLQTSSYIKERIILEITPSIEIEKTPQSHLLELTRKEQIGTGMIQLSDIEKGLAGETNLAYGGEYYIGKAWQYYNNDNFKQAIDFFIFAEKFPETELDANHGKAHCYSKCGKLEEAIPLFEKLVKKKYKLNDTLPSLISLLVEKEDYAKALACLDGLERAEKEKWQKMIEEMLARQRFQNAMRDEDINLLILLTQTHQEKLNQCTMPDLFYNAAETLIKNKKDKNAIDIYLGLFTACSENWDLRLGILYALKSLLPFPKIHSLVKKEVDRPTLPSPYRQGLTELRLNLLKQELVSIPSSSPMVKKIAGEILTINPDDTTAISTLSWWYYHKKQYNTAYDGFSKLYQLNPQDKDYALGLIYTLIALDKFDEALETVKKCEAQDKYFVQLRSDILLKRASDAYEIENYSEAETYLKELLELKPDSVPGKSLMAWSLYKQEKLEEALTLFTNAYNLQNDPKTAAIILRLYEKMERRKEALSFASSLSETDEEQLHKVAGDFYFGLGWPIRAAQVYDNPDTRYYNAANPGVELFPHFRFKSGDNGLSRLNEIVYPLSGNIPFHWGNEFKISFDTKKLMAGNSPQRPFVGKAFRSKQQHNLTTSLWVFEPTLKLKNEGKNYTFQLGTTPLNGPIYPIPTFLAQLTQKQCMVNIHQVPVEESILSYVGLEDPYGEVEWGRVVRSGVEGGFNLTPYKSYWLSLKAGFDYYWGKNLWENYAIHGDLAFGRTIITEYGDLSLGIYATAKHFNRNSGFYTFGHGGYFSPEFFFNTGPTIKFQTKAWETFWIETQLSAGFMSFQLDSSPHFPIDSDQGGIYKKEKQVGSSYSILFRWQKLLNSNFAVGGFFSANKSSNFTDVKAGLSVKYFIGSR